MGSSLSKEEQEKVIGLIGRIEYLIADMPVPSYMDYYIFIIGS
jgi:hypothetical protein